MNFDVLDHFTLNGCSFKPAFKARRARWALRTVGTLAIASLSLPAIASYPLSQQDTTLCSARLSPFTNSDVETDCDRAETLIHKTNRLASKPRATPVPSIDLLLEYESGQTALPPSAPSVPVAMTLAQTVDVDPAIVESSPVLQRWLEEIPDIATDIQHDPAFRTRLRLGYAEFPSDGGTGGLYVGVQDIFVGQTPLTLSAEYSISNDGDLELVGADAQYYLLPMGWYGNVAPVVGYRSVNTPNFNSDGINLGLRIVLIPSRTGAADLSITQSWVAPGTDEELGLTTFSAGYAIAEDLRVGTDIQTQNARDYQESRVSLLVEWML
ncbi:hypothetical protein PN498_17620 [Oscillatoria sp. CS-180]|uniref:hypothetical protein n=1 Tax=Oscillatoria sp. CS-180 TaxID=3021720 RepID=UPI00232AE5B0|nr:hypothetical protein [Oscillatoria sp. CS-180]MDB9527818.1 hypothetical protein [Oscillatoria sp. CS-180]